MRGYVQVRLFGIATVATRAKKKRGRRNVLFGKGGSKVMLVSVRERRFNR